MQVGLQATRARGAGGSSSPRAISTGGATTEVLDDARSAKAACTSSPARPTRSPRTRSASGDAEGARDPAQDAHRPRHGPRGPRRSHGLDVPAPAGVADVAQVSVRFVAGGARGPRRTCRTAARDRARLEACARRLARGGSLRASELDARADGTGPGRACGSRSSSIQLTGSFKVRGAALRHRGARARAGAPPEHVVAASAGNHGAGVAHAGPGPRGEDHGRRARARAAGQERASIAASGAELVRVRARRLRRGGGAGAASSPPSAGGVPVAVRQSRRRRGQRRLARARESRARSAARQTWCSRPIRRRAVSRLVWRARSRTRALRRASWGVQSEASPRDGPLA